MVFTETRTLAVMTQFARYAHLLLVLGAVLWCSEAFRRFRNHLTLLSTSEDPNSRSLILMYWGFTLVVLFALMVHWYDLLMNAWRAWN